MFLDTAEVGSFKSIQEPQIVTIDAAVTVLVGMNEAGKTVFLQALEKSNDVQGLAKFDPIEDYPRRELPAYLRLHPTSPAQVTNLTFRLTDTEVRTLNDALHTKLPLGFSFSHHHLYNNTNAFGIRVDESPALSALLAGAGLSSDTLSAAKTATSIREVPKTLAGVNLSEADQKFITALNARIAKAPGDRPVIVHEVVEWLAPRVPKFLYFGDYDLLPSKTNLAELAQREEQAKSDPKHLTPEDRGVLALLRMADIGIGDFTKPGGYEPLKAKIEGVSISLTDQIMQFWKQNEDLEVEVDIKPDPDDIAPFNSGPNLYLRIKNRRHRGVSTPFRQRSKGFIWFFSFLVWFDSVQQQLATKKQLGERDLILLLDEPGLSLHALAQADFLRYIDTLAKKHQVLYTTHSPFMIHSDPERMKQVRTVEDQAKVGTVISNELGGLDARTLFPLQAALGWTIAQNLFISKRNLIVEGVSELMYLKAVSGILEAGGRTGLREDVTIAPVGGLDKVATFVALLGANGLDLAIFHDYRGAPEQRLLDLVKEKMITPQAVLNASQFVDLRAIGTSSKPADIEDLFGVPEYLGWFSATFTKALGGVVVDEASLPAGDRIVDRLERFLKDKGINTRPSGGFNHYLVASHFVSHTTALSAETLGRFEALFATVNKLFQ